MDTPFLAIGNEELGDMLGDTIACPRCGEKHAVEQSTPPKLQLYKCGDKAYLCGIGGKSIATPLNKPLTARELVEKQAADEALWFIAIAPTEQYLQDALRKLHKAVEAGP